MGRIEDIFAQQRANGHKGLMPFICAGYPQAQVVERALPALQRAGAAIVEVGFPFSDPIADGPVIAAAMHKAIAEGCTPALVFEQVAAARHRLSIGLVAMVSYSIVFKLGGEARFCGLSREAGFDGVLVPDLPVEEAGTMMEQASKAGLSLPMLAAPTTPPARLPLIVKAATGFVYLLARAGITGEREDLPRIGGRVGALRELTDLPIACGFGISTPEQVRAVVHAGGADAAIVGSALVRTMGDAAARGDDPINAAEHFSRYLAGGLRAG